MIDFSFANFAKLVLAFLLAFLQSEAAAAHSAMVTVGDEIDGMTLTTGAADARPLWVFCATAVNKNVTTAHCQVSEISRLAIGHAFLGANSVFHKAEWSQLKWELYLDDLYIDLDEFGTYDYVQPSLASHPARVREVFMKFTAWDVVLTNLQPGVHTLEGRVFNDTEEYRWNVTLAIADPSQRNPAEAQGIQSRCSSSKGWLSRLQGSCRLYG